MSSRKKGKKSEPKVTHFAPRRSPSRPVLALAVGTLCFILTVALWDYHPDQPGLFPELAQQTDEDGRANLAGRIGRDYGFVSYTWTGMAGWVLPLGLLWMAAVLAFRRAHLIRSFRPLLLILLVPLIASLLVGLDQAGLGFPFVFFLGEDILHGRSGGVLGELIFEHLLQPVFGVLGGNAVVFACCLAIGFYLVPDGPGRVAAFLQNRFIRFHQHRQKAKEERLRLREERRFEKKRLKEEKKALKTSRQALAEFSDPPAKPREKKKGKKEADPSEGDGDVLPATSRILSRWNRPERDGEPDVFPPSGPSEAEEGLIPPPKALPRRDRKKVSRQADDDLTIVSADRIEKASAQLPRKKGTYQFPSLNLLAAPPEEEQVSTDDHHAVRERLRKTLEDFGVKVEPGEVHIGPVITRYDLHPAAGVRVEKIAGLERNIGMALKATSVRILAPVPGKGCVGVEVPNANPAAVYLREILESKAWVESKAEIPLVLGKEVSGRPLVTDLTRMPHLLIAGSTGSGKTVCINTIVTSLLYHSTPEDLRFIMIDPKIVEMQGFNELPHMMIPVVTDPKKVPAALKWLLGEMERRYQIFARLGVRNIAGFNSKILKDREERAKADTLDAEMSAEERVALARAEQEDSLFDDDEIPREKLPYIVCIVDELADLMMVAPADIETCIARLAQLARAAGIHLIIATQRPSVNVITGVIKANLPSRIAFKVAQKVDSRTILDGSGADALIGKGDMLFIPPGAHTMIRAQGAFVSEAETAELVEYLKRNGPPRYVEAFQRHIDEESEGESGGLDGEEGDLDDPMLPQAIDVLRSTRRASTSMLQRRLRIGYNRAARLMEILEDKEIVGPENGAQPREILVDLDSLRL